MTYSLGTVSDLKEVAKETHNKSASIDARAYPLQNSDQTQLFDFGGVVRRITINGTYIDTSQANVMTNFVDKIEAILDGDQSATITFHSDLHATGAGSGNFNVMIESFNWNYSAGTVLAVDYTIVMVEGTSL